MSRLFEPTFLVCPSCGGKLKKVTNTCPVRDEDGQLAIRRYRVCNGCGGSVATIEVCREFFTGDRNETRSQVIRELVDMLLSMDAAP